MRTFSLVSLLCLFMSTENKILFHSLCLLFPDYQTEDPVLPANPLSQHSYLIRQLDELCSALLMEKP